MADIPNEVDYRRRIRDAQASAGHTAPADSPDVGADAAAAAAEITAETQQAAEPEPETPNAPEPSENVVTPAEDQQEQTDSGETGGFTETLPEPGDDSEIPDSGEAAHGPADAEDDEEDLL